jgi:RNA polymerase primary sigma factor
MTMHSSAPERTRRERDPDHEVSAGPDLVRAYLQEISRTPLLTAEQEVDLAQQIEVGLYAEHRLAQADAGVEKIAARLRGELAVLAEDGRRAKAHMLQANLRLVVSVAKRYPLRGMSFLDIVQEGNLGVIRAVEKFDYRRGFKFSTYATWWIRQAISRAMAEQSRTVRLPVHVVEKLNKLERVSRTLHQNLEREPTAEELAEALDSTPEDVEALRRIGRATLSLDSPIGDDAESRVGDLVVDDDAPTAEDAVERGAMVAALRDVLATLPERESRILAFRFGLVDGRQHTLDEIGRHFGLTRERIRQLEKEAMAKLRHPSRTQQLLDYAA